MNEIFAVGCALALAGIVIIWLASLVMKVHQYHGKKVPVKTESLCELGLLIGVVVGVIGLLTMFSVGGLYFFTVIL